MLNLSISRMFKLSLLAATTPAQDVVSNNITSCMHRLYARGMCYIGRDGIMTIIEHTIIIGLCNKMRAYLLTYSG